MNAPQSDRPSSPISLSPLPTEPTASKTPTRLRKQSELFGEVASVTTALRAVKATTAPELRAIARAVAPTDRLSQSQKNVLNVGLALPRRIGRVAPNASGQASFSSSWWPEWSKPNSGSWASCAPCPDSSADQVDGRSPGSRRSMGGRPRLGKGPALFGIRPASSRARRSSISIWALRLRNSSAAHRARASWTAGSIRSSTCLRSFTDHE